VQQKDSAELARALERLISDPELRARLGQAGYARVRQEFSMERGIDKLVQRLQLSMQRDDSP